MRFLRNCIRYPHVVLAALFCIFNGIYAEILLLDWARDHFGLVGGIIFFLLQALAVWATSSFGRVGVIEDEQGGDTSELSE